MRSCFHLANPGSTGAAAAGQGWGQHFARARAPPPGRGPDPRGERESGGGGGGGSRMQGKKPGGSSGGGRSGELQGDEAQRNKKKKKKVSCFSNIKIFLVSECALMLAQGTVGAYLVSTRANSAAGPLPQPRLGGRLARGGDGGRDLRPAWRLASGAEAAAGGAAGWGCRASQERAGPRMPAAAPAAGPAGAGDRGGEAAGRWAGSLACPSGKCSQRESGGAPLEREASRISGDLHLGRKAS